MNTALRSIKNSEIKAHDLKIKYTNGNSININNTTGYFINCEFDNTEHPTINQICVRKSSKCENKKLDNIEININENDNDFHCKSWVSPTYIYSS